MLNLSRRPIGKLLVDGKFLSTNDIENALEEQKHTKDLLGHVLVRMGVLAARDVETPLRIQGYLNHIKDAAKVAAGERQLLGTLLVESGHITIDQLDHAIAEQKRSGERMGEVFIRLGLLSKSQLAALLDFQHNQAHPSESPLRLGELLISTGHISRSQLDHALLRQSQTGKRLGEVLVGEGYTRPKQIRQGIRLQKRLLGAVLAAIMYLGTSSISFASSVDIQWDPPSTVPDLAGYKVYYAAGTDSFADVTPIEVQNQTSATINGLDPEQTYYFAVTAYNTAGEESSYSNIVNINELLPPTVAINTPADASKVSGTVLISLDAFDNVGITKIEFYINGVLTAVETAAPYAYSWDTSALASGTYTIMAKAYDAAGNVGQSGTITTTVVSDNIAPTAEITSPINNAVVSGSITINVVSGDNVGISKVEIYVNGDLLSASNVAPYNIIWDTTSVLNGNYTINAKAYDQEGNIGLSSLTTVTVNNSTPDTTAPTLTSFTMPATSTSQTVTVFSFAASDNVAVTGYLITESAVPPFASASGWSTSPPTKFTFSGTGTRTAYAWAKDAAGNISSTKSATVKISKKR